VVDLFDYVLQCSVATSAIITSSQKKQVNACGKKILELHSPAGVYGSGYHPFNTVLLSFLAKHV
jgi:hypothetical protein